MHHFITTGPPVFLVKSFSTLVSLHFIKQFCSAIVDKKPGNSHLGSIFVGRGTNTKSIIFCTMQTKVNQVSEVEMVTSLVQTEHFAKVIL